MCTVNMQASARSMAFSRPRNANCCGRKKPCAHIAAIMAALLAIAASVPAAGLKQMLDKPSNAATDSTGDSGAKSEEPSHEVRKCADIDDERTCPVSYTKGSTESSYYPCIWTFSSRRKTMACMVDRRRTVDVAHAMAEDSNGPTDEEVAQQDRDLAFSMTPRLLNSNPRIFVPLAESGADEGGGGDKRYCHGAECTDIRYLRANDGSDGRGSMRIPDLLSGRSLSRERGGSVDGTGPLLVVDGWPEYDAKNWEGDIDESSGFVLSEAARRELDNERADRSLGQ